MKKYNSILELIGNTPLIELKNIKNKYKLKGNIYAKLEGNNPFGSIKDRTAYQMIIDAEKDGLLKEGSTIIEPTSGNTGVALAAIGKLKGYEVIIVMPSSMSIERIKLIKSYGGKVILTEASLGMQGAINKAKELIIEIPNSLILGQFTNPSNPKVHFLTTGKEIYEDLEGNIDIFISGIGTGGTISGTGEYLKNKNPNIKVIGVEPQGSPLLTKGEIGGHKIQGIGANFIPKVLNINIYDKIICISDEEAFDYSKKVCKIEGLLVGISSGAALCAAIKEAQKEENLNKNIVVILPDTGTRYLSTSLFSE